MNEFSYHNRHYQVEDVKLRDIAEEVGTPFYCYSLSKIEANYLSWANALDGFDATVCYAVKANSNQAIISALAQLGAGADVVSEGELRRALAAGIPASRVVYSGVAKTDREIRFALTCNIRQFNVESEQELRAISTAANELNTTAKVAFRINPDIDAGTHEKIATGKSENKFGIGLETARSAYKLAHSLPGIEANGIDIHIGSQILNLEPFERAFLRIASLIEKLRQDGHKIDTIDLGGGLGIDYGQGDAPSMDHYAEMIRKTVGHLDCSLIVEPGRSIVGNAGILVGSVIYTKKSGTSEFLIIDAAMNDFLRPSMYDAYHAIFGGEQRDEPEREYDVVGPVCETGDTFARRRTLPIQKPGDLVVIEAAGAYGSVMASTYNTRPMVPEVMVKNDRFQLIRRRPDYESMIGLDIPWDG